MKILEMFKAVREVKADVDKRLTKLQSDEEMLRRERDVLIAQPAAKSDIKAMVGAWFDKQGTQYRDQLQQSLTNFILRPQLIATGTPDLKLSITGPAMREGNTAPTAGDLDQLLVALLGPALRPALLATVDAMSFEEGPPMHERSQRVAEIDARIAKIRAEIKELVSHAEAAGISLD